MVFRKVSRRFEQPDTVEAGRPEPGGEFVPECDYEVFRRGNDPAQKKDFLIQVPMVAAVDHGLAQNIFQFTEVDQVTGLRIRSAADRDLKDVIVSMPVRVRAETILLNVPSMALARIKQPMSRIEVHLPRDGDNARLDTGREWIEGSGFVRHGFGRTEEERKAIVLARVVAGKLRRIELGLCYERRYRADAATKLIFPICGAGRFSLEIVSQSWDGAGVLGRMRSGQASAAPLVLRHSARARSTPTQSGDEIPERKLAACGHRRRGVS